MTKQPHDFTRSFRLLHFQSSAAFGGDEANSLLLCRHLPEMRHRIAVYFGSGPMVQNWSATGAEVTLLGLNPSDRGGVMRAVRRTTAATSPDGVFLSSVTLLPLVLTGLGDFRGEVLCHTGNPESSSMTTRLKFWAARAWLRPKAHLTLVHCSEHVRRSFADRPFFRAYRHEVAISAGLMGVNGEVIYQHHPRRIARDDVVRLGMLARLDPIKNHRLVLDAFPRLLSSYPRAVLEFIGEGVEMGRLRARARELGIGDRVVFHGSVPSPFPLICEWDLFLYATTAAEGFGAALAEAMTLGLPSVVTDVGPMREVGGDDGAVRYVFGESPVGLGSAAASLIGDYHLRMSMSALARERASSNFDGASFARRIAELLGAKAPPRFALTPGRRIARKVG